MDSSLSFPEIADCLLFQPDFLHPPQHPYFLRHLVHLLPPAKVILNDDAKDFQGWFSFKDFWVSNFELRGDKMWAIKEQFWLTSASGFEIAQKYLFLNINFLSRLMRDCLKNSYPKKYLEILLLHRLAVCCVPVSELTSKSPWGTNWSLIFPQTKRT